MVQELHFSTIIETLNKDGVVNKTTHKEHGLLYHLDPMLDEKRILELVADCLQHNYNTV